MDVENVNTFGAPIFFPMNGTMDATFANYTVVTEDGYRLWIQR